MSPSTPFTSKTDVVVVGAGVQGLAAGLFLARAGREVVILECGDAGREASGVNAGSLAIQNKRLPLVPFAREAVRMWAGFQATLGDVGFVPSGGLKVAESDDDVVRLSESADQQRALGLDLEWLEGAGLRRRAPWLGAGVVAATFCAEDSFAIPLLAGLVLLEAARKAGCGETARGIGKTVVEVSKFTGEKFKEGGNAAEPKAKGSLAKLKEGNVKEATTPSVRA